MYFVIYGAGCHIHTGGNNWNDSYFFYLLLCKMSTQMWGIPTSRLMLVGDIWNRSLPLAKCQDRKVRHVRSKAVGLPPSRKQKAGWPTPVSVASSVSPGQVTAKRSDTSPNMQRFWKDTAATCCATLLLKTQTQALTLKLMCSHFPWFAY